MEKGRALCGVENLEGRDGCSKQAANMESWKRWQFARIGLEWESSVHTCSTCSRSCKRVGVATARTVGGSEAGVRACRGALSDSLTIYRFSAVNLIALMSASGRRCPSATYTFLLVLS